MELLTDAVLPLVNLRMNRQERRRIAKLSRQKKRGGVNSTISPGHDNSHVDNLEQARMMLENGHLKDTIRLCQQIITMQNDHTEALNLCAIASFQLGDISEGIELVQAAVASKPDYVEPYNNLGNMLKAIGRLDEAEVAYRKATEVDPNYSAARFNLAILLEESSRLIDAEQEYLRAIELNPYYHQAMFCLGNVQKSTGRFKQAIGSYKRTLQIYPDNADAYNNLGSAQHELGQFDAAIDAYHQALKLEPNHLDAQYNLGSSLQESGQLTVAINAYKRTLAIDPNHVQAHINLGYALHQTSDIDAAKASYEKALQINPRSQQACTNLGDIYLHLGYPNKALALCDKYLESNPGDTGMLAFKALALNELGNIKNLKYIIDFDRFLKPVEVVISSEIESVGDLNADLIDYITNHPSLVASPTSHATRFGRHSGELFTENQGAIFILESEIRRSVDDYILKLPEDVNHPFSVRRPTQFGLTGWGVVMDRQGHQIPHIHPQAWLSGVYYVQLPDVVSSPSKDHEGWIEFGRPPDHYHCTREPYMTLRQPRTGIMFLFPSYFYHRTIPFDSSQSRICIAFDVVPLDSGSRGYSS